MKRSRLIIISLLILIFIVMFFFFAGKFFGKRRLSGQNTDVSGEYTITGVLREMDLDPSIINKLSLKEARYQLVNLNPDDQKRLPFGATSLFLEKYSGSPADMLGKCVTVKGEFDSGWVKKLNISNDKTLFYYDGLVFNAKEMSKQDFNKCSGISVSMGSVPVGTQSTLYTGRLQRKDREVPDVGPYDYNFVFENPLSQESSQSTGTASNTDENESDYLPVVPLNNEVWAQMEGELGKLVTVEAYKLWGYAESKYLLVVKMTEVTQKW